MNNSDASIFSLNSINSLKFIFIHKKGLSKNVGLNEIKQTIFINFFSRACCGEFKIKFKKNRRL